MQPAFNTGTIRQTLLKAVQDGRFSVEDLDRVSEGCRECMFVDPAFFKHGYQGIRFRNLLRDHSVAETVELTDPKDLPPLQGGVTPPQEEKLPLTPEAEHRPPVEPSRPEPEQNLAA